MLVSCPSRSIANDVRISASLHCRVLMLLFLSSIAIGHRAGDGCGYYRTGRAAGQTFETNSGKTILGRPTLSQDGQTIRMIIDFTRNTIEFIVNGTPCPVIKMDIAGVAGHPLKIAASCDSQRGGSVRVTARLPSSSSSSLPPSK